MKKIFLNTITSLTLAFGLSGLAYATDTGDGGDYTGNQDDYNTMNDAEIGGWGSGYYESWNDNLALGDGQGDNSDSESWTLSERMQETQARFNVNDDAAEGCLDCGDIRLQVSGEYNAIDIAGAKNTSSSTNGPAVSNTGTYFKGDFNFGSFAGRYKK